jgi:hypothetical protein
MIAVDQQDGRDQQQISGGAAEKGFHARWGKVGERKRNFERFGFRRQNLRSVDGPGLPAAFKKLLIGQKKLLWKKLSPNNTPFCRGERYGNALTLDEIRGPGVYSLSIMKRKQCKGKPSLRGQREGRGKEDSVPQMAVQLPPQL